MSRTLTLALASATAVALLAPAALAAPNDPDAAAAADPIAAAAADPIAAAAADPIAAAAAGQYVAAQVPADGNLGGAGGTADAALALIAVGGHDTVVATMADYLETEAATYAAGGGPAAAKLALVAAATGRDATDFGGVDLVAAIQGSIAADGACGSWAYAFGNALCILGLDRNGADVPDTLLASSLGFQDPESGAFGYVMGSDFVAETDASGLMLSALAGVAEDRDAALAAAAVRDYLVQVQTAEGYWENYSPINATGLVAPALETVGVPQDAAVAWLAGQQLEDGGLPNVIDGTTSNLMATTQGLLPFTGESYLSVGVGGTDSVELVVRPDSVDRVAGEDRYRTAVAASAARFAPGVDTVYVATGLDYADALTGSALAGSQQAPVLLVQQDRLPSATAAELDRLAPDAVVVLGGTGAVSEDVLTQVGEAAGAPATRLAGTDRYETAAAVAGEFADADHVFVATAWQYADALAASAAAGADDVPVLLVAPDRLPEATVSALEAIAPETITLLGGTAAVADEVETALGEHGAVTRVAGEDRYATAAALAASRGEADGAVLATGLDYPDALTGAAYAAADDVPVLLLREESVPAATLAELHRTAARELVVFGGTAVVSQGVLTLLEEVNYAG